MTSIEQRATQEGRELKEIADAHIAAARAMRGLRPPEAAPKARARARATAPAPLPRPKFAPLMAAVLRACRPVRRTICLLDPRTHTRIKRNLERLERREVLVELGLVPAAEESNDAA